MKNILIDTRMRRVEKDKIKDLGYNLIEIKKNPKVYEEISSHVDIFACKIGNKVIIEPSQTYNIPQEIELEYGAELIEEKYPKDIKYNICIIGKKAIHNFKYTDSKIKKELEEKEYEIINTTQGYTNCSIAVIDENSAIVTDKGLYKILMAHGIDVLYIKEQLDIKLLKEGRYSSKKGFIGGAISKIGNKIIIFGDLSKIDQNEQMRNFIKKRNIEIIEFKGLDVIDYGGILEIGT